MATWEERDEVRVSRAVETLQEICADDAADLARLSVGLRVVRSLLGDRLIAQRRSRPQTRAAT